MRVTEGSHRQFVHPSKPGKVTVAGIHRKNWTKDEKVYTKAGWTGMTKYAIFIAPTSTGFSAHVPDLPGCIATGRTREQTLDRMRRAIELHLRAMREDGDPVPAPSSVEFLSVA